MSRLGLCRCVLILITGAISLRAGDDAVDRSWAVLRKSLDDANPVHRAAATAALGSAGAQPRVISTIEGMLDDKDYVVRQTAAATLGELKATSAIPRLKQALNDEAPEVVFTAAKALWNMGDHSGSDVFLEILAHDRGASSGMMKGAMRDAKVKMHSPTALARMGVREASGALLGPFSMGIVVADEAMKDGGANTRALCASLLATDSNPETIQPLADALTDKNPVVRAAAIQALGHRLASNSISTFVPLLEDNHTAVRCMAAATIIKLDTIPYRAPGETTAPPVK